MATLFDLSHRKLMRLQSLDPVLDADYSEILEVIFYILDDDSKRLLLTHHLNPKGIFYDAKDKTFGFTPPKDLTQILSAGNLHPQVIKFIKILQNFCQKLHSSPPPARSVCFWLCPRA